MSDFDLFELMDTFSANRSRDRNAWRNEIISISEGRWELFETASESAIEILSNSINQAQTTSSELTAQLSNFSEDNNGIPTQEDIQVFDEIADLAYNMYTAEEHLKALSEMKIVYLFKSLEISMKSLIKCAYPEIKTKSLFKWESMVSYFKTIQIKIPELLGYEETTELRKVNNCIKHNGELNEEILKIDEFKDQSELDFKSLNLFYDRVRPKIESFTKELRQAIIDNLFVFDNARLDEIAYEYKLRMDPEDLAALADRLVD